MNQIAKLRQRTWPQGARVYWCGLFQDRDPRFNARWGTLIEPSAPGDRRAFVLWDPRPGRTPSPVWCNRAFLALDPKEA